MKHLALVMLLGLSGCVTAMSTAAVVLPLITTSIDAACASSQALAQQAAATPQLATSSKLVRVNNKIATICGVVDPASAQAGSALYQLNTATAQLLGAAGAAGVQLRGLR